MCILFKLSLPLLSVPSSSNKLSHCTEVRIKQRGRSPIKMQNKSGPRIDPSGTLHVTEVFGGVCAIYKHAL